MSRWSIDPPDDNAYDVRHDSDCADCGRPAVAWLCEDCSDQRESWAAATEQRMATSGFASSNEGEKPDVTAVSDGPVRLSATTSQTARQSLGEHARSSVPAVVDVALVPIQIGANPAIVEVALVPIAQRDARELKRMAKAILSADLTNIREIA